MLYGSVAYDIFRVQFDEFYGGFNAFGVVDKFQHTLFISINTFYYDGV